MYKPRSKMAKRITEMTFDIRQMSQDEISEEVRQWAKKKGPGSVTVSAVYHKGARFHFFNHEGKLVSSETYYDTLRMVNSHLAVNSEPVDGKLFHIQTDLSPLDYIDGNPDKVRLMGIAPGKRPDGTSIEFCFMSGALVTQSKVKKTAYQVGSYIVPCGKTQYYWLPYSKGKKEPDDFYVTNTRLAAWVFALKINSIQRILLEAKKDMRPYVSLAAASVTKDIYTHVAIVVGYTCTKIPVREYNKMLKDE